jgi:excisionase family DNA binding protein
MGHRAASLVCLEGELMTDRSKQLDRHEMMTVTEAAAYLRVSRDLAYELVRRNVLPHVRLGRVIRVPRFGLEQWIAHESGLPLSEPVTVTSAKPREH